MTTHFWSGSGSGLCGKTFASAADPELRCTYEPADVTCVPCATRLLVQDAAELVLLVEGLGDFATVGLRSRAKLVRKDIAALSAASGHPQP